MLGSSTYELIAKISSDTSSFDKGLSGALGKFDNFKGKLIKIAGAIGLGKLISDSLTQGGELEQSIGGIETLFGAGGRSIEEYAKTTGKSVKSVEKEYGKMMKAQEIALSNADRAYATVGVSANEYMQNVTGFAASLNQSLGGDVVKSAKVADMAMIDMSDNANKMGTDMGSIQNAYQGFAKQNYTIEQECLMSAA